MLGGDASLQALVHTSLLHDQWALRSLKSARKHNSLFGADGVKTLDKLKAATGTHDLAALLGYKAKAISYILYKIPDDEKYRKFELPKKSGGVRKICAPNVHLRLLQRRLANVLYDCREQIDEDHGYKPLSHGFRKRQSIITNAKPHKRRRYVLNLDLQDYFPSFNFGRVRGFFIKNRHFALNEKVATLIAQIACFENELPQGSPCSPVIADLITHPLDVRLAQFAKKHSLTYTRYADDLTFSTSKANIPEAVVRQDANDRTHWLLGDALVERITREGFTVNPEKTRLQLRGKRQVVTGLTVNAKVNVSAEYYRRARAMCHSLFTRGNYHRPDEDDPNQSLSPLEGILSHIHSVKEAADLRDINDRNDKPTAFRILYKKFLFYRYFVRAERPLILCEGKTDNVYLHYAIRKLTKFHPKLGDFTDEGFRSAVGFFSYKNAAHKILEINGGTGGLKHLIVNYKKWLSRYRHPPLLHPIILLIDNDDGATSIFKTVKQIFKVEIVHESNEPFYWLTDNLYLVKTPENIDGKRSCIENMFDAELLKTKHREKVFNPTKEHESEGEYGKDHFSRFVVRPNADTIDFTGFTPLLQRLAAVMDDYTAP